MSVTDKKVCRINDPRIANYTNRQRNGSTQVFYTGNDPRDWDRYRAEDGPSKSDVKMHDKADTIYIKAPEQHYYAELIDGEWWWLNGCDECNGREYKRCYIKCIEHDICQDCATPQAQLTEIPWGTRKGFQCKPCHVKQKAEARIEALSEAATSALDRWDFFNKVNIRCPRCNSKMCSDDINETAELECEICDQSFKVEVEYTPSYTMTPAEGWKDFVIGGEA